jgi:membrane protein
MSADPRSLLARAKALYALVLHDANLDRLPWWQAQPLRLLRIGVAVLGDLAQGQISLNAMSLVYTTLLSLVPVLAISFSVLKGFGVHNQMEPLLLNLLAPLGDQAKEVTGRVIAFVENINVGVLGSLGLAFLLLTVVSLMQKIERAFNAAWRVTRQRGFAQRFSSYLTVVIIGPVLVFSAIGLTATLASAPVVSGIAQIEPFGRLFAMLGQLLPFVLIVGAFTFLYAFLPNTRVRLSAALGGGVVAGVLWEAVGWGFASVVVASGRYTAIYSAFATLILFLLWLYLAWLILLVGTRIAFYVQNPHQIGVAPGATVPRGALREWLGLAAMRLITRAYYGLAGGTARIETLAAALRVPDDAVEAVTGALEQAGLLVPTGEDMPAWLPATPPEETPLERVLEALRLGDMADEAGMRALSIEPATAEVMARVDSARARALDALTVKDLAHDLAGPGVELAPAPRRAGGQA